MNDYTPVPLVSDAETVLITITGDCVDCWDRYDDWYEIEESGEVNAQTVPPVINRAGTYRRNAAGEMRHVCRGCARGYDPETTSRFARIIAKAVRS